MRKNKKHQDNNIAKIDKNTGEGAGVLMWHADTLTS